MNDDIYSAVLANSAVEIEAEWENSSIFFLRQMRVQ